MPFSLRGLLEVSSAALGRAAVEAAHLPLAHSSVLQEAWTDAVGRVRTTNPFSPLLTSHPHPSNIKCGSQRITGSFTWNVDYFRGWCVYYSGEVAPHGAEAKDPKTGPPHFE